jgi:hypothetical protein
MAKERIEDSKRLDVGWFQRHNYLLAGVASPGRSTWRNGLGRESSITWTASAAGLWLSYTITPWNGKKQDYSYQVRISYTELPSGGRRAWFHCPAAGCGRRCKILYMPPAAHIFACRRCHDLAYTAQQDRSELGKRDDFMEREIRSYERLARLLERTGRHLPPDPSPVEAPAPVEPPAPPAKRPRGRPRTKRRYTRRAPLAS